MTWTTEHQGKELKIISDGETTSGAEMLKVEYDGYSGLCRMNEGRVAWSLSTLWHNPSPWLRAVEEGLEEVGYEVI